MRVWHSRTEFLGFKITGDGITSDPMKLQGIMDWPIPQTLTHIKAFLGFANFYREFIPCYSNLIEPLNRLSRKDVPWHWGDNQQGAFAGVKNAFKDHVILKIPDPDKAFILETDASLVGIASVLNQVDDSGQERPCAFYSCTLIQAEQNYEVYD